MADQPKNKKKLKGFKEFDPSKYIETEPTLEEAVGRTAVFAWGRMNPITVGHEKLVKKVAAVAKAEKGVPMVFLTHSFDKKKNPLTYDDKIRYSTKAFGPIVQKSNAKTIFQLMAQLQKMYKRVVLVAGSDRVQEFNETLNKYNGREYNFDEIKVVSAGARDADSDDVSGASGTKMREYASKQDMKNFTKYLPKNIKADSAEIMLAVRKGMGMSEEVELDEALSRQQRRKRSLAMKRARFKIKRGKEKAMRKVASTDILKKRARKAALNVLKQKFAKNRRYAELNPGEKEVIDKKVEKINKKRIEAIARKLFPKVKAKERERHSLSRKGGSTKNESVNEASCVDTKIRKKPHMLLNKEGKVKFDGRFKLYKKKVNESADDLYEEINNLIESTEAFAEDYYKGVPKDKKDDREAHFKRYAEKPGDGSDKDSNYKSAPGDFKDGKRVKTKVSKHTKKYQQMYGEEMEISEDATASLKKKAEKTGMPMGILRKVYNRGVAAWKSGHRPGTTPEQWGHARVNSFVTKSSGTWGKADSDLASKVRGSSKKEDLDELSMSVKDVQKSGLSKAFDKQKKDIKKDLKALRDKLNKSKNEEAGAGEEGTDKLVKKYKKDTPNA